MPNSHFLGFGAALVHPSYFHRLRGALVLSDQGNGIISFCLLPISHLPFGQCPRISLVPWGDYCGDSRRMSTLKEYRIVLFCPLSPALIPKIWCSVTGPLPRMLRPHWTTLFVIDQQEGCCLGSERWEVGSDEAKWMRRSDIFVEE